MSLLLQYAAVTVLVSGIIALLLLARPLFNRIGARWRCLIWLVLALRLLIPWRIDFSSAPVAVSIPAAVVTTLREPVGGQIAEVSPTAEPSAHAGENTHTDVPTADAERPSVPSSQESASLSMATILLLVWAAGTLAAAAVRVMRTAGLRRALRRSWREPSEGTASAIWAKVCAETGYTRVLPIRVCPGIGSPMTVGLFRPVVVLPDESTPPEQLAMIFAHEQAHLLRWDIPAQLVFAAAGCVQWFNPLVYLLCRQARLDSELACDDRAVNGRTPEYRRAYCEMMLSSMAKREPESTGSTQFSGSRRRVGKRLRNAMDRRPRRLGWFALGTVILLLGLTAVLVSCRAETPESSESSSASESAEVTPEPTAEPSEESEAAQETRAVVKTSLAVEQDSVLTVTELTDDNTILQTADTQPETIDEEYVMTDACQAIYDRYIDGTVSTGLFPYTVNWDETTPPDMSDLTLTYVFQMCWQFSHDGEWYDLGENWEIGDWVDGSLVEETVFQYFAWPVQAFRDACTVGKVYDTETYAYWISTGGGSPRYAAVTDYRENGELLEIDLIGWTVYEQTPIPLLYRCTLTLRLAEDGSFTYVSNVVHYQPATYIDDTSPSGTCVIYKTRNWSSTDTSRGMTIDEARFNMDCNGERTQIHVTNALAVYKSFLTDDRLLLSTLNGVIDYNIPTQTYATVSEVDALDNKPHRLLRVMTDTTNGYIILVHVEDFTWDSSIQEPRTLSEDAPNVQVTVYDADWKLVGVWDTKVKPFFRMWGAEGWKPDMPNCSTDGNGTATVNSGYTDADGNEHYTNAQINYLNGTITIQQS